MRYVIIGNSAAGIGAVEGIRSIDKQGGITVITSERHHTYSRPLISYLLGGNISTEKLLYRSESFYRDNNCMFMPGKTAARIDASGKAVILDDGSSVPYDKLLVATGSSAFVPPFEGLDTVGGVHSFMSLDDAERIEASLNANAEKPRVLIIGAGLIGLKCAEGIVGRACGVTVVDMAPRILSSILDDEGAEIARRHIEGNGINFRLNSVVKRFDKNTAFLEDGEKIEFDALVTAVGVRPNTALLKGIADIDKGIITDEKSQTTAADIYAAGDCTQAIDISSGQGKIMALLPNAYMQGECAGVNMAGGEKTFGKAIPMNAIGFFGLHIITAGTYRGSVYEERGENAYKRLFYSDNRLNGYILVGNAEKAGIYTSLIRERTPLDETDFELICERPGLMAFTRQNRAEKLGTVRR